MISTRHLDTQSLINLLTNGGFDHLEQVGDNLVPHFWELGNVVPRVNTTKSEDIYSIVQNESLTTKDDVRDYISIRLATKSAATMTQSFLIDPKVSLDFPVPLVPGSTRAEISAGYLSPYDKFLVRSNSFTIALSVRTKLGAVSITATFLDTNRSTIAISQLVPAISAAGTKQRWRRYATKLTPEFTPAYIQLTINRAAPTEYLEAHIGNIQLVCGAYEDAPYTGDRLLTAIPKNAIIMSMGLGCPPGFVQLEEPENVTVPESWAAQDPSLKARLNLYPVGAEGTADPAALVGDPTHNRESYKFTLTRNNVEPFESFDSLTTVTSRTYSTTVNQGNENEQTLTSEINQTAIAGDEASSDGKADHQHNVSAGGSIPVTRAFRFCRKL